MTEPLAQVDDVRGEIQTELDESTIQPYLEDAAFEIGRVVGSLEDGHRKQLEKKYAAIKILTRTRERSTSQQSVGNASKSYERGVVSELEREIHKLDPSGELLSTIGHWTVTTQDVGG